MNKLAILPVGLLSIALLYGIPENQGPDLDANEYAQNNAPQFINVTKRLHLLDLKGNESVLDFGCRDGRITNHILEKYLPFGTIHGVDSSAEFIQYAQQHHTQDYRLSFERANIINYAPTKQYDAVTSFMLLHWTEEYEKALQVIFDALKPGGKALIMTLAETDLNFLKAIKELLTQEQWNAYAKNYTFPLYIRPLEQITTTARAAGLRIYHLQLVRDTAKFKDSAAYQHHFQAMPLANCIPAEKKEDFFKQVAERSLPHETHHPDGSITLCGYVIYMVLEKPKNS